MAEDLYTGLQRFFKQHPHLRHRPLVIAGESYAGARGWECGCGVGVGAGGWVVCALGEGVVGGGGWGGGS